MANAPTPAQRVKDAATALAKTPKILAAGRGAESLKPAPESYITAWEFVTYCDHVVVFLAWFAAAPKLKHFILVNTLVAELKICRFSISAPKVSTTRLASAYFIAFSAVSFTVFL